MRSQFDHITLDECATDRAQELLAKATWFRHEGKPEQWARDVERKALKKLEWSFVFRNTGFKEPVPKFMRKR